VISLYQIAYVEFIVKDFLVSLRYWCFLDAPVHATLSKPFAILLFGAGLTGFVGFRGK
jgi:hypothetical protein